MTSGLQLAARAAAQAPFARATVGAGVPVGFSSWSSMDLAGLVARMRVRLGGCEPRVAASTLHLGLVARLWALEVAAVGLGSVLSLDGLWWADEAGSVSLHLSSASLLPAESLVPTVLALTDPLGADLQAGFGLAAGLLRGNVASGLVGACRSAGVPDLAEGHFPGTFEGARRRSCCLYYRVGPGSGVCGDCCFEVPPAMPARAQLTPGISAV